MDAVRFRRVADLLIARGLLDAARAGAFVKWLASGTTRTADLAAVLSDLCGLGASQIADALELDSSDLATVAAGAPGEAALRPQDAASRDALRAWLTPGTQTLAQDLRGATPPTLAEPICWAAEPPGPVDEAATPTVRLDPTSPALLRAPQRAKEGALVCGRYEVSRRVTKGGMGAILL